jgi:hypothetical protein
MAWQKFNRKTASRTTEPTITIQRRGTISCSGPAVDLLLGGSEKPDKIPVELLYDPERELVGIKLAEEGNPNPHLLRRQGRSEVFLVSGTFFCAHYNISTDLARRYCAQMHDGVLGIRLADPHATVGRRAKELSKETKKSHTDEARNGILNAQEITALQDGPPRRDPWSS